MVGVRPVMICSAAAILLPKVWQQGSVSLAARAVNLTQPAVTQGIAKLEAQLGVAAVGAGVGDLDGIGAFI